MEKPVVEDSDEMNFDSSVAPVWQLPVPEFGFIRNGVKYHCFVNNESLCDTKRQHTDNYDEGISIESAAVLEQPHKACKRCLSRWKKLYQVEG